MSKFPALNVKQKITLKYFFLCDIFNASKPFTGRTLPSFCFGLILIKMSLNFLIQLFVKSRIYNTISLLKVFTLFKCCYNLLSNNTLSHIGAHLCVYGSHKKSQILLYNIWPDSPSPVGQVSSFRLTAKGHTSSLAHETWSTVTYSSLLRSL